MITNFNVITEKPFFLSLNKQALTYSFQRYERKKSFPENCVSIGGKCLGKVKKKNIVARSSVQVELKATATESKKLQQSCYVPNN